MPERYSRIGALPQIILLMLLIAVLVVGGFFWFDYLGLVDAPAFVRPILRVVGIGARPPVDLDEDVMLLDRLRLEKLQEAVELRNNELDQRAALLAETELGLLERVQHIEQRAAELDEKENSLNQRLQRYDNRRAVLEQNSRNLTGMTLDAAVAILVEFDDQLLIDVLRVTEELAEEAGEVSLVSVWLARMPAARAADIQRKMTLRPNP